MSATINRRNFLMASTVGLATRKIGEGRAAQDHGFTIALGGGAARGLAHIAVPEAIDDLGVLPLAIAGTSIGALIGACYASGMKAREIREYATDLLSSRLRTMRLLFPGSPSSWTSIFSRPNSAMLDPEVLMSAVMPPSVPDQFYEVALPLLIVTTDFHLQEEFIITDGLLSM